MTAKEKVAALVKTLPDDVSLEEIRTRVAALAKIEKDLVGPEHEAEVEPKPGKQLDRGQEPPS